MEVGMILTVGQILDSSKDDWNSWCVDLKNYSFAEDTIQDQEKLEGQIFAWKDCFKFLRDFFPADDPTFRNIPLLFEYRPPLRNGRRTDVIALLDNKVIVLEFKATKKYLENEIVQTNGYVHYLTTSHDVTLRNHMNVEGYLVRTRDNGEAVNCELGTVLDKSNFTKTIRSSISGHAPYKDVDVWVNSETTTIPSIMEAIHILYTEGKTKELKYLKDGDLGDSLPFINAVINDTQSVGAKAVVIVDGVPGSGKTYLGTQVAFERKSANPPAVYISGNDPLINYMQTILSPKGSTNIMDDCPFVIGMKTFKSNFIYKHNEPQHGLIVFDEAQRAWDEKKMNGDYSEIECLLQFGDRVQKKFGSCIILCLFGVGQAIHGGEEQGLRLWDNAIRKHQDWNYYVSDYVGAQLNACGHISRHKELRLSTSIRNNFIDLSDWIEAVVENKGVKEQRRLLNEAKKKGFQIRITRHMGLAKNYMITKTTDETYGILVSSFVNVRDLSTVSENTIHNSYMSADKAGAWFTRECKEMNSAASEFVCQGLELDWPFVLFGGDFYLKNGEWKMEIPDKKRVLFEEPEQILRNVYRILLSRGRKGMFIVVPQEKKFDETYQMFIDMGIGYVKF